MLSIIYFVHNCSKGRKNEKGYDSLTARLKFNHFILNGRLMRKCELIQAKGKKW